MAREEWEWLASWAYHPLRVPWGDELRVNSPHYSASIAVWRWQKIAVLALFLALAAGVFIAPLATRDVLLAVFALTFFLVVLVRVVALVLLGIPRRADKVRPLAGDTALPLYSVLVPLYKEAGVIPGLLQALGALDYPKSRLEILLLVEQDDEETRGALRQWVLPGYMRVIVVPAGTPRTKPRALTFGLRLAHGSYVAVYDAEDEPEPSQLRRALAVLRSRPGIGCVQSSLKIHNARAGWLTGQFALEYTALFDGLLPALARLRLPIPLGGTSNHFPRAALTAVGGWDPYNVTEDADLGIRLARAGYTVEVVNSTTWEEAPVRFRSWLPQRTRWLKGWLQTYLVHMRTPFRLWRELGTWQFFGLQVLMGGMIISPLIHPWFYVMLAAALAQGSVLIAPEESSGRLLFWLSVFNLAAGYVGGIALACAAAIVSDRAALCWKAPLMPLYWLLISVAAYRALWQLVSRPHYWEKTTHSARRFKRLSPRTAGISARSRRT